MQNRKPRQLAMQLATTWPISLGIAATQTWWPRQRTAGKTIIAGGYLNTELLEANSIVASKIAVLPDNKIASASTWHAKETPSGAQAKADAAESSAKTYASSQADAAKTYASTLLQSMADGTYTGGTFIDGKSIMSPTVVGLQGTFAELMAGDPFGARLELGRGCRGAVFGGV